MPLRSLPLTAPLSLVASLALCGCFDVDPLSDTDTDASSTASDPASSTGPGAGSSGGDVSATSMGSGSGMATTAEGSGTTTPPMATTAVDESSGDSTSDTDGPEVECGAEGEIACGDGVVVAGELCLGAPVEVVTGSNIRRLSVFDFDLDGIDDVVVGQFGSTSALLLRGTAGGLTDFDEVSMQVEQWDIATGDFTDDGLPDIIAMGSGERRLTIRRGDGAGGFAFVPHVSAPDMDTPSAIAVADLNGDGRDDVALAHWTRAVVYITDPRGIPSSPIDYDFAGSIHEGGNAIALADVDDGNGLDLVTGAYDTGTIAVMRNNGAGAFSAADVYETAPGGSSDGVAWVRAADLNQDELVDIVADDFNWGALYPHMAEITGTLNPGSQLNVWGDGGFQLGDFDDDCAPDVAAHDGSDNSVQVFANRNDGSGTFTVPSTLPNGAGSIRAIGAGDFNGDGVDDVVIATSSSVHAYLSNP